MLLDIFSIILGFIVFFGLIAFCLVWYVDVMSRLQEMQKNHPNSRPFWCSDTDTPSNLKD